MKPKTYKNRGYKEITTTETPYLNIFTGQRIFIDPEVVPPKNLFYVEDLNPYQRTISVVMDTRQRRIIKREKEKRATNIFQLIKTCIDQEDSHQLFGSSTYTYPIWFEDLLGIMYFGVFT